ncbi:unnamed protein product, partial [marine sediment metagenome]
RDGAPHDIDVSAVVPVGCKWVYMEVALMGSSIVSGFSFKPKGFVSIFNIFLHFNKSIDTVENYYGWVQISNDRLLTYTMSADVTNAWVTFKAWVK